MGNALGAVIVVGGGMPGVLAAALLARRGAKVTLLEKAPVLGGLYGSVDMGAGGVFDHGMHLIYDSGIEEVDALMAGLLPQAQWHVFEGNRKDIAGAYWRGALQEYSPYLNLRGWPQEKRRQALAEVAQAARTDRGDADNAEAYARARFGALAGAEVCAALSNMHRVPAHELSAYALSQPAMDRVLLVDAADMAGVFADEALRARIGYPDQLGLPVVRAFAQKARYPRRMGMQQVVDAMERHLVSLGVKIVKQADISALEVRGARFEKLQVNGQWLQADALMWTAGLAPLCAQLCPEVVQRKPVSQAAQVYLRFAEKPSMGELYHFYVFDAGCRSFRVTHFGNYCEDVGEGWPLCVEYWPQDGESDEAVLAGAVAELMRFGVVQSAPLFGAVRRVPNYHQMFLRGHIAQRDAMRGALAGLGLGNVFVAGVMAQKAELLMFQVAKTVHAQAVRCAENLIS